MKKQVKVSINPEKRNILGNALNSTENEKLDLYKVIFGGKSGPVCQIGTAYADSAYNQTINPK